MSIRISDLVQEERTITIMVGDEELSVTYRPKAYTPLVEDQMQSLMESNRPGNGLAQMLSHILINWDVVDENNKPIETTFENIRKFPVALLTLITQEINKDNRAGDEDRKNSGGGSRRGAKSDSVRTGSF
ncbi:hypothetical protein ADN00_18940 [Ornatilinea apprima]|uniref:Uncharacterized protein n=1 Tax=Ornatilinea apprima TaxID=1134406 RepID=A0A0P6XMG9_9CHLR|nr:hypothetical protein [Ornatilinea apprima]KPL70119.1 hypothetical protein ADN00_18940 [Ornatilinea apprima]